MFSLNFCIRQDHDVMRRVSHDIVLANMKLGKCVLFAPFDPFLEFGYIYLDMRMLAIVRIRGCVAWRTRYRAL